MKLSISMTRNEVRFGWAFFLFQLLILPSLLVTVNQMLNRPLSVAALNFSLFAINFLCTTVIFHRFLLASGRRALALPFRCLRMAFFGLLLYYAGIFLVSFLINSLRPDFANANDANILELTQENYPLMAVGIILLAPITEELLYRGLIFHGLHSKSRMAAYAVSTLAFAAIHVVSYVGTLDWGLLGLSFVQYLPAGLSLAWAYEKSDTIWAPILMHITINQISITFMR